MTYPSRNEIMAKAYEVQELAEQKIIEEFLHTGHPNIEQIVGELAEGMARNIPAQFEWFLDRWPGTLDNMIDDLSLVSSTLNNTVLSGLEALATDIEDWEGTAAVQFRRHVLQPFPYIKDNQVNLVEELSKALWVLREMLRTSREDLMAIAEATITALEGLESGDGGVNWVTVGLGVASAALMVAGAATGNPATAAFGVTTLQYALARAGVDIADAVVSSQSSADADVGGETVVDVLDTMVAALDEVRSFISETEDGLTGALRGDVELVEANLDQIAAPRPTIADDQNLDDFRLPVTV